MSNKLFADLGWLQPAPADFKERCRALEAQSEGLGKVVRQLASYALNVNQLQSLSKQIARLRESRKNLAPLAPLRLGVLSDGTTTLLVPSLIASAARHGVALEVIETDFGQVAQEAFSPDSTIHTGNPDAVLIALSYRLLPFGEAALGDAVAEQSAVARALDFVTAVRQAIHKHSGKPCIVQTVARPPEPLFGSFDFSLASSMRRRIEAFNRRLAESLEGSSDVIFDVAALAETVGLADWDDPVQWNIGKLPFSQKFVPWYADSLARVLSCMRGGGRKCLVLDLDNTLWGGVIGDDGLEGIRLGQSDPLGEAFLQVQRTALSLRDRGIMLAVCSKNEEEAARLPFRKHPEMLLKESHITVFQANWTDKASNLKAIAEHIGIGTDALVFLDDNPAEREQVRQVLPEVAVPELPADPSYYSRTLLAAGYFEGLGFSAEDRKRVDYYAANAERAKALESVGDLDSYLRSLEMSIHFAPFDAVGRARIAQLINKSNQFNLTTRRMDESQVAQAEGDPNRVTLQVRLVDRFGDNGMISVVICEKKTASEWDVDTWLMSCRVLKRRVEEAVLNEIVLRLRERGARRLVGRYVPTPKNKLVQQHYEKLGFRFVEEGTDQSTAWELDLDAYAQRELPMQIIRTH